MKKSFLIASVICAVSFPAAAQFSTDSLKTSTSSEAKTDIGNLLITLSGALKPDSYKSEFAAEKKNFINRVKTAKDAKALASVVAGFAGYIKTEKYKSDANTSDLINTARSGTTVKQSAGMLKAIEKSLRPETFGSIWNLSRSGWLKEVSKMEK